MDMCVGYIISFDQWAISRNTKAFKKELIYALQFSTFLLWWPRRQLLRQWCPKCDGTWIVVTACRRALQQDCLVDIIVCITKELTFRFLSHWDFRVNLLLQDKRGSHELIISLQGCWVELVEPKVLFAQCLVVFLSRKNCFYWKITKPAQPGKIFLWRVQIANSRRKEVDSGKEFGGKSLWLAHLHV